MVAWKGRNRVDSGRAIVAPRGQRLECPLAEDTEDMGSDLAVDDGLVAFANNIDAELLMKFQVLCNSMTLEGGGRDSR